MVATITIIRISILANATGFIKFWTVSYEPRYVALKQINK